MNKIYHYYEADDCIIEPLKMIKESVTDSDWEAFVREHPDYKEEAFDGERRLFKYCAGESLDEYTFDVFILTDKELEDECLDEEEDDKAGY